jgi:hypothetical protein
MLLVRLYWIHRQTNAKRILLASAKSIWDIRDREILSDVQYPFSPIGDLITCSESVMTCKMYSEACFIRFDDGCYIFRVRRGCNSFDLKMIDRRPYFPGRARLMELRVQNRLQEDNFNVQLSDVTKLRHLDDKVLPVYAIISLGDFIGIEMNRYCCAISRLWGSILRSKDRVNLVLYWMEETLRRIFKSIARVTFIVICLWQISSQIETAKSGHGTLTSVL